jgi:hypothetical protein
MMGPAKRRPAAHKVDAYRIAFEAWLHNRKPASRELRAAALDDLAGNQVPLTPLERQRARMADDPPPQP